MSKSLYARAGVGDRNRSGDIADKPATGATDPRAADAATRGCGAARWRQRRRWRRHGALLPPGGNKKSKENTKAKTHGVGVANKVSTPESCYILQLIVLAVKA